MDCAQIEFIAEQTTVSIIPNFRHDRLYLISGDVGPFEPNMPVEVPLWIAVHLKQRQKCHIIPPPWMNSSSLEEKKREEVESPFFTKMPSDHYREVTQILLDVAADDIPEADSVQTHVKDIWDIRLSKLRTSIDAFMKNDELYAKIDHLTVMEINTIRGFLTTALGHLAELRERRSGINESRSQLP
ncbi:DNA replication complex GINS protein PSF2-like [Ornithodoros turicata]|uniref:DNA replication complex GINS protein PSF2-like n=1 Tax=Ornithodoros turicata TaxID=34597 RepID=UPI003138AC8B